MGGKILENKKLKLSKLCDAAYELFSSNGVHNTIIDDIVKNAGVAKGTFYLYFKDKYDLVDKVIVRKTSALLNGAMEALAEKNKVQTQSFQQSVIFIADYLINFFMGDKKFLELIHSNLSLNLYQKMFNSEEMAFAEESFIQNYVRSGGDVEKAQRKLFIITSLICSVCYNTVALDFPYKIEEIKQDLYDSIEKMLTS